MVALYLVTALVVIGAHYERIPQALVSIVVSAFTPQAATGGFFAVLIIGFRRAALSNEAGIGSAAIAHSAARTREPITQGLVAMLEPFIDTMVICMITALVITVAYADPTALATGQFSGVELTSDAFASVIPWFPYPLALVVFLFAYSTMISWSYYGLEGSIYLFGARRSVKLVFNTLFCGFVVIGCATQLEAILEFSDAMVFAMALVNVAALFVFAPTVRRELASYWQRHVDRLAG
jgi:AGCS family alanine or glycine:cation symporter